MKIEAPVSCPSCGGKLELVNAQLFCRNTNECPAQSSKLLESFTKKMKLKGLGKATIEKLGLVRISDLFYVTLEDLHETVGVKVGDKIAAELEEKLHGEIDFGQFLGSLGIPLIGEVAAQKLSKAFNSLEDVKAEGKAGINLSAWKQSLIGKDIMEVPWKFSGVQENSVNLTTKPIGISVCITGSVEGFKNRTDASSYLETLGFSVKKSVTKDVKYLICEDETKYGSSAYKKAEQLGIDILTIKELEEYASRNA